MESSGGEALPLGHAIIRSGSILFISPITPWAPFLCLTIVIPKGGLAPTLNVQQRTEAGWSIPFGPSLAEVHEMIGQPLVIELGNELIQPLYIRGVDLASHEVTVELHSTLAGRVLDESFPLPYAKPFVGSGVTHELQRGGRPIILRKTVSATILTTLWVDSYEGAPVLAMMSPAQLTTDTLDIFFLEELAASTGGDLLFHDPEGLAIPVFRIEEIDLENQVVTIELNEGIQAS